VQWRNTTTRFGAVAQTFHWVIVALLVIQFVLAYMASPLPTGLEKLALLSRHKGTGMTIFILALLRLIWRWANPAPPLPDTMRSFERGLARFTHGYLYFILFTMPVVGWIMSSAANHPVSYFGLFTFPNLVAPDKTLVEPMKLLHQIMSWSLLAVVAMHIAGALRHHFVLKDDTLLRMLPPRGRRVRSKL
jgi:cytochrome b561